MPARAVGVSFYFLQGRWIPPSSETLQVMPQLKIQDGVGLLDAEFNGSFVLQCITCQLKREIALGPPTIPFPNCNLCGGRSNCTMRQKLGVVFVNFIDRVNQIVRRTLQLRLLFTVLIVSFFRFFRRLAIALLFPIILQTACPSAAACTDCKQA